MSLIPGSLASAIRSRKQLFLRFARAARDLATGRPEPAKKNGKAAAAAATPAPAPRPAPAAVVTPAPAHPEQFQVTPAPPRISPDWPEAPVVEDPERRVRYFPTYLRPEPHRFDVELFEQLNAEYESKPIWPSPPKYDTPTLAARTRKTLSEVHRTIDLSSKRVLEIGCGTGYNVWYLAHHLGSEATGLDVAERASWQALSDERTKFVWADITDKNPFPEQHFDRVISFAVWEHMTHPFRALQEVYRMLKPGGLSWMNANLYRGPVASHLYREIKFPWPHLLFSDEVIKEFYRRRGMTERGATWVNKLTWAQYERYFELVGFKVRMLKFIGRPFDEEFYKRFEHVLNRYPIFDLSKDFFTVVLERPAGR